MEVTLSLSLSIYIYILSYLLFPPLFSYPISVYLCPLVSCKDEDYESVTWSTPAADSLFCKFEYSWPSIFIKFPLIFFLFFAFSLRFQCDLGCQSVHRGIHGVTGTLSKLCTAPDLSLCVCVFVRARVCLSVCLSVWDSHTIFGWVSDLEKRYRMILTSGEGVSFKDIKSIGRNNVTKYSTPKRFGYCLFPFFWCFPQIHFFFPFFWCFQQDFLEMKWKDMRFWFFWIYHSPHMFWHHP